MKKLILTLFAAILTISVGAQTIGEAFYIYRNDGQFNAFLRDEVDSIAYSSYDVDSLYYDEIVTQIIYTVDSIYKIPLASIDSVSFVTPETKYTPQVVKMEPLLPYIVGVDGMELTFSSDIPSDMFPKKDDVLVLDKFDYEQFPMGFAGRMVSKDGLQITCDSVSFEDIYEHFLCYGYYTAVNDNNDPENSRVRLVARRRVEGNVSSSIQIKGTLGSTGTGLYASVDGSIGLDLRFTFKYNTGEPVYYDISLTPELSFNLEASAKGSFLAPLDLDIPLLVIPIPDSPFYFKLSGGPVWEASLEASVVVKTDAKLGYKFGVKYENGSYKWAGENTSKWFSKPDITGNMKGSAFIGLKLETGIYSYGNIISTTIEKKAGAEFEASISENIQNPDTYNDLRNGYLDVNLKASADFKAEAKLFKWLKLSAKYNILSGKVNIYKFKLVPTFTKPNVSLEKSSAIVSVIPNENLLFPVSIGLGLWNNNNVMLDAQFCEGTYSDRDSWPLNEFRTLFPNLAPNIDYTVRPLVKLFGGTIVAPPEETFKISVLPVTLDVYDIEETTAKVYGKIDNYELLDESIKYGIGYTTEGESGETLFDAMDEYGGGVFSVNLMALKPNTTYNYFAYMEIYGVTYYGETKQFTTKGAEEDTSDYEAYAVLNDSTLTFYYDNKKEERGGMDVKPFYSTGDDYVSSGWFEHRDSIVVVVFDDSFTNCTSITDTNYWFSRCSKLKEIKGLEKLNTTNVTDMRCMFRGCSSLTSLDLSSFNTTNVTTMSCMFESCNSLTSLDLSGFNTTNVTTMSCMFAGCNSLTSLDLSSFNTTNVTTMSCMFESCNSLTSLGLSSFNTANVTDMHGMFWHCSSLISLDVSNFDTSNVTDMCDMFISCSSLTNLDLSSFDTSNVTNMDLMFYGCSSLTSLDVSNFDTSNVTKMALMFLGCSSLTDINARNFVFNDQTVRFFQYKGIKHLNLSNANTTNVTNMSGMFRGCSSLTSLDLSSFDTSNVTDMSCMFWDCSSLISLDVSNFDTSNVTKMDLMFLGCSSLTDINARNFVFNDQTVSFFHHEGIKHLNLSNANTTNVTNMSGMFRGCSSLTSLDLSSFDTSNVTDMSYMLWDCSSLTSLDLSSFNTSNVTNMTYIFHNCGSLKTIYAGNWNNSDWLFSGCNSDGLFSGCSNLEGGQGTKLGDNLYGYDENGHPLYYYCPGDGSAAHIDGGRDNPGLFTAK